MKKLWMALVFLAWCAPAPAQERFNGYSTMVVTTWAAQCASMLTPLVMNMWQFPMYKAQMMAAATCACTIDHFREEMSYKQVMALSRQERREKSEIFTMMCAKDSEEL